MDRLARNCYLFNSMDRFFKKIKLRKLGNILFDLYKEPSNYQIIEIFVSISYLFVHNIIYKFILIFSVIAVDFIGIKIHKKYRIHVKDYEKNNTAVNRITELFIFSAEIYNPLGKAFFFMAILNTLLSYHKLNSGRNLILDLKLIYLFPLAYSIFFT